MTSTFEKEYEAYEAIKAAYDAAKDEAGQEAAREDYKVWAAAIQEKGDDYAKIYKLYQDAKEAGNEVIDLHDTIWDNDAPALIESLRKYGIKEFTFSSTWSSAVKTAWIFKENGCSLKDLVMINSQYTAFMSEEREKAPAYLFTID